MNSVPTAWRAIGRRWAWWLVLAGGAIRLLAAAPYTPKSDDEVLERLPEDFRGTRARQQRQELAEDPENVRDSVALARSYLTTAQTEGDPRYLGYARSVLRPWWDLASPPASVLWVRGWTRAAGFEFDRARADYETALAQAPTLADVAWARLEVQLAQGDFRAATEGWQPFAGRVSPARRAVAKARLAVTRGQVDAAFQELRPFAEVTPPLPPDEQEWVLLALAELARRQGRNDEADRWFGVWRRLGRRNVEGLAEWADFQMDQHRPAAVDAVLSTEVMLDPLAVRWLESTRGTTQTNLALRAGRDSVRTGLRTRLEARLARGDATVLPVLLRFLLREEFERATATELARDLWTVRRELRDARIVLEAARRIGDATLATPVRDWVRTNQVADVRLEAVEVAP